MNRLKYPEGLAAAIAMRSSQDDADFVRKIMTTTPPDSIEKIADDLMEAAKLLASFRIFTCSREKAKQPEGTDLFDQQIERLRRVAARIERLSAATGAEAVAFVEYRLLGRARVEWLAPIPEPGTKLYATPPPSADAGREAVAWAIIDGLGKCRVLVHDEKRARAWEDQFIPLKAEPLYRATPPPPDAAGERIDEARKGTVVVPDQPPPDAGKVVVPDGDDLKRVMCAASGEDEELDLRGFVVGWNACRAEVLRINAAQKGESDA